MEFSWDLYYAVIVANIAGNLEAEETIYVADDEVLTHAVCQIVNEFMNDDRLQDTSDMFEYADKRLMEIFAETDEDEYDEYVPSSANGDYGPSNPWDAPGMSVSDFI